jgi:hypothetical protein
MFRPNSGHRQVYNSSAVRILQYASLHQGVEISKHTFCQNILYTKNCFSYIS